MAQVTMSVLEEFFAAVKHGNLEFFIDILDISLTNVMQGQEITTAQRLVKQWAIESQWPHSVIPMEHLRLVYGVLTDNRLSQREFQKKAERCGITRERKREHNTSRQDTPVRGVVTQWRTNHLSIAEIANKYFDDKDLKLLGNT